MPGIGARNCCRHARYGGITKSAVMPRFLCNIGATRHARYTCKIHAPIPGIKENPLSKPFTAMHIRARRNYLGWLLPVGGYQDKTVAD